MSLYTTVYNNIAQRDNQLRLKVTSSLKKIIPIFCLFIFLIYRRSDVSHKHAALVIRISATDRELFGIWRILHSILSVTLESNRFQNGFRAHTNRIINIK